MERLLLVGYAFLDRFFTRRVADRRSSDSGPAIAVTPAAVPRRDAKIRPWRWRPPYPRE